MRFGGKEDTSRTPHLIPTSRYDVNSVSPVRTVKPVIMLIFSPKSLLRFKTPFLSSFTNWSPCPSYSFLIYVGWCPHLICRLLILTVVDYATRENDEDLGDSIKQNFDMRGLKLTKSFLSEPLKLLLFDVYP